MRDLLTSLLGVEGTWLLAVVSVGGVAATFAGFGWAGAAVGIILFLALLALAALRTAYRYKQELDPVTKAGADEPLFAEAPADHEETRAEMEEGDFSYDNDRRDHNEVDGVAVGEEEGELLNQSIDAAVARDFATARTTFSLWLEEVEPKGRLQYSVSFEGMLASSGDRTALERLRTLADSHPREPAPIKQLGETLYRLGLYREAADEVRSRAARLPTDVDLTGLELQEALAYFELGEHARAEALLQGLVQRATADVLARAHSGLARIAEVADDPLLRLHHLARAVVAMPNDSQRRFDLAYAASPLGFDDLAAAQYQHIEQTDDSFSMALNNLGVILGHHNALALSRDYMKKAMDQGNSLAAGNLADAAALAGFVAEAEQFLQNAADFDDTSPRLADAQQRIALARESSREALDRLVGSGNVSLDVLLGASPSGAAEAPMGAWDIEGRRCVFEQDDEGSMAGDDREKYRFKVGPVLRVYYSASPSWSETEGVAARVDDGHVRVLLPSGTDKMPRLWNMHKAGEPAGPMAAAPEVGSPRSN